MLNFLFSAKFAYTILGVAILIAVLYLLFKYPQGWKYVWGVVVGALVISCAYCGIHLNLYYSAKGGIYGYISSLLGNNNNQVTLEIKEKTFNFKNIVLTQDSGDIYSAKMITSETIKLNDDEMYGVYVNGTPCGYTKTAQDYFKAFYTYNFYNRDDSIKLQDTLELYFQLNNSGIEIEVLTRGGSEAVKYWNYYFNKNNFEVKIAKVEANTDNELLFGEGKHSYLMASFYENNTCLEYRLFKKGSEIVFPSCDNPYYQWTVDGKLVEEPFIITEDIRFDLKFCDPWNLTVPQRDSINSAVVGAKGGLIKKLVAITNQNSEQLRMLFEGESAYGDKIFYSCSIDDSNANSTADELCSWINSNKPGCTVYTTLSSLVSYEDCILVKDDFLFFLSDIYVSSRIVYDTMGDYTTIIVDCLVIRQGKEVTLNFTDSLEGKQHFNATWLLSKLLELKVK